MCGRFSQSKSAETLSSAFQLAVPGWTPRYNIAPTQAIPTVSLMSAEPERQFRLLRWGLVPGWAKDLSMGAKLINARSETVAEKPSFRSAFKQRRCLILADGFYEWQRSQGKKQPYYIQMCEGQPFAFAGLWERWQKGDSPIESCTILTTQANELMQPIHDRMPVILSPQDYDLWLDPTTPAEKLHSLLLPYDAQEMQRYPVSSIVNSAANENPDCVKPFIPTD
ncbi:SOS response-associated peptidase [Kovacikia minuta CCNUW1]|uniref:SOS response-associated peptidase n=1 Tax=Kovacikia minuta TaxID=2931930 RepID=UPI001CCA3B8C|nr:SOS response-associated peptidase [Kovacikia minuta]UBF26448.1 SOS response-associated peptidase [Kovacikia minuta CCNUW1]